MTIFIRSEGRKRKREREGGKREGRLRGETRKTDMVYFLLKAHDGSVDSR